jgi:trk system potassium uptake protein TrkA
MKFCVIGVGRFGYQVATTLADNGMEVLAVDSNESIIASIRDKVTQAICMRVNDEEALRSIGVEDMATVIVAMGENFAESILVTAILKQKLKIQTVITRSISDIHRDILQVIGADSVILPEQEVGRRVADTLSLPFDALVRLSPNFCISQLPAPLRFVDQTITELALPTTYGVICIGQKIDGEITTIDEDYTIRESDILILSGAPKDMAKVAKLV